MCPELWLQLLLFPNNMIRHAMPTCVLLALVPFSSSCGRRFDQGTFDKQLVSAVHQRNVKRFADC